MVLTDDVMRRMVVLLVRPGSGPTSLSMDVVSISETHEGHDGVELKGINHNLSVGEQFWQKPHASVDLLP